jgi:hypothetical protein
MPTRQVPKDEWKAHFERVPKILLGMRAQIEVAALNIGDQIAAEWVAMRAIVYDDEKEVLRISLDCLISKPREIYVDEGQAGLPSFEVVGAAAVRHIVQLREPLMLPAPSAGQ